MSLEANLVSTARGAPASKDGGNFPDPSGLRLGCVERFAFRGARGYKIEPVNGEPGTEDGTTGIDIPYGRMLRNPFFISCSPVAMQNVKLKKCLSSFVNNDWRIMRHGEDHRPWW